MFFSYFPTKLSDENPKKDLIIDDDSLWGIIDFYFFSKYALQLVT
jgi:hypothetical protein